MPPRTRRNDPVEQPEESKPADPVGEDKPEDTPAAENTPDSDESAGQEAEVTDNGEGSDEDKPAASETLEVDIPCPACYPQGWPDPVPGASVSCHHGLVLRYGETAVISAEVAKAITEAMEASS